jgi:hypothetical protein
VKQTTEDEIRSTKCEVRRTIYAGRLTKPTGEVRPTGVAWFGRESGVFLGFDSHVADASYDVVAGGFSFFDRYHFDGVGLVVGT